MVEPYKIRMFVRGKPYACSCNGGKSIASLRFYVFFYIRPCLLKKFLYLKQNNKYANGDYRTFTKLS